jgi:hypothetical protein
MMKRIPSDWLPRFAWACHIVIFVCMLIGWRFEKSALHRRRWCIHWMEFRVCVRMRKLVRSGNIQPVRRTWLDLLEQYAVAKPRRLGAATPVFYADHGYAVVSGAALGLRVDAVLAGTGLPVMAAPVRAPIPTTGRGRDRRGCRRAPNNRPQAP